IPARCERIPGRAAPAAPGRPRAPGAPGAAPKSDPRLGRRTGITRTVGPMRNRVSGTRCAQGASIQKSFSSNFATTASRWKSTSSNASSKTSGSASTPYGGFFEYDHKKERLEEVGRELEDPTVWTKPERAQ